ncbi:hypothetical protein TNCV_3628871 [Trichonephila clavipes]|nr:hypothetical protein TNCV_3628871 [Trichonephila clavipes]
MLRSSELILKCSSDINSCCSTMGSISCTAVRSYISYAQVASSPLMLSDLRSNVLLLSGAFTSGLAQVPAHLKKPGDELRSFKP